jgi:hypothetical protein
MNIFAVDNDPKIAAQSLCDKHVVKMVTESAQMLSTVHRLLDGVEYKKPSKSGKRLIKAWKLNDHRESLLMGAVHMHHPCTVWSMQSSGNYVWHYLHYVALAEEYTYRYGKEHGSFVNGEKFPKVGNTLATPPKNIPNGPLTDFAIAMSKYPECIIKDDPITSYRNYYHVAKKDFAVWTRREVPEWYSI